MGAGFDGHDVLYNLYIQSFVVSLLVEKLWLQETEDTVFDTCGILGDFWAVSATRIAD